MMIEENNAYQRHVIITLGIYKHSKKCQLLSKVLAKGSCGVKQLCLHEASLLLNISARITDTRESSEGEWQGQPDIFLSLR